MNRHYLQAALHKFRTPEQLNRHYLQHRGGNKEIFSPPPAALQNIAVVITRALKQLMCTDILKQLVSFSQS